MNYECLCSSVTRIFIWLQMHHFLLGLIAVCWLGLAYKPMTFTQHSTITPTFSTTNLAYSPDSSLALLYTPSSSLTLLLSTLNMTTLPTAPCYTFTNPAGVTFFTDEANRTSIVYVSNLTEEKKVIAKMMGQDGSCLEIVLKRIGKNDCLGQIGDVVVSSDGQYWAVACLPSPRNTLYVGKFVSQEKGIVIEHEERADFRYYGWRPNTSQVFMSGGNGIAVYDPIKDRRYELQLYQGSNFGMQFSSNGTLCLLDRQYDNKTFIRVYKLQDSTHSSFSVPFFSVRLQLRGKFVALGIYEGDIRTNIYQANRPSYTSENYFTGLYSGIQESGLSPDGSLLITRKPNINEVSIGKLCNQSGYYYDLPADECLQCQKPCLECVRTKDICTHCIQGYYFMSNLTCVPCYAVLPHCQNCSSTGNSGSCLSCLEPYLLNNNTCLLCGDIILNCAVCLSANQCQKCIESYTVTEGKCQLCAATMPGCRTCLNPQSCLSCNDYYTMVDEHCQTCQSLMEGCATCLTADSCSYCQTSFVLSDGRCVRCSSVLKGCLRCNSTSSCLSCDQRYALVGQTCALCSELMEGCETCLSQMVCQQCLQGYQLHENLCILCSRLIEGCLSCLSEFKCRQCAEGYKLDGQKCQKQGHIVLVLICVGVGLVVCGGVGVFLRKKWKGKGKKEGGKSLHQSMISQAQTNSQQSENEPYPVGGYLIPESGISNSSSEHSQDQGYPNGGYLIPD